MVEAIAKVGRALGIATVAEWVESERVLDELRRIGVDYAQGFHIARPLPLSQLPP
jgi:Amt family ammonium transporter